MTKKPAAAALLAACMAAAPVAANTIDVTFQEDAPKDRFIIENKSTCPLETFNLKIDLAATTAGLFFDTQSGGEGVNVYQPLEIAAGSKHISELPKLSDGARHMALAIRNFQQGDRIVLTVDVDDSVPQGPMSPQMIATSEMAGAEVGLLQTNGAIEKRAFDAEGKVMLPMTSCDTAAQKG